MLQQMQVTKSISLKVKTGLAIEYCRECAPRWPGSARCAHLLLLAQAHQLQHQHVLVALQVVDVFPEASKAANLRAHTSSIGPGIGVER